jgi:hypothetical protein
MGNEDVGSGAVPGGSEATPIVAHTPGPWKVEGPYSVGGGGTALAIMGGPAHRMTIATVGYNKGDDLEACRADAALVAAAPEMLAVLRECADYIGPCWCEGKARKCQTCAINEAIAKAEGR